MKKRRAVRIISYLACAVVAVGAVAAVQYERAERYRGFAELNYSHAYGELATAVEDIDTALKKSLYATSPALAGSLCAEVYAKCQTARMALGVLPLENGESEQTSGFINRAGDFAMSLTRTTAGGVTGEQREALSALSRTAAELRASLEKMRPSLEDGTVSYERLEQAAEQAETNAGETGGSSLGDGMLEMEEQFPESPQLIYDGPYSSDLEDVQPRMTEGLAAIDEDTARAAGARFLGITAGRVRVEGKTEGKTPHWRLAADAEDGEQIVTVTERGGLPLLLLRSYSAGEAVLSKDESLAAAQRFLERRGYKNMTPTWTMQEDGVLSVSFAWLCGDAVCYTDLIKMRVAMDTGTVVGFDATGYVSRHYARELLEPTVSREAAASALPEGMNVLSGGLAVIPTAGEGERLCHEFVCDSPYGGRCIIYVNAYTGAQEDILLLVESENGALTI